MKSNFIKIPVVFDDFFPGEEDSSGIKGRNHTSLGKTMQLKDSVDDFLELLITSHLGEYKHDIGFGFEIWEKEFENIQIEKFNTHNFPRQDLERSLASKIEKYEPRIRNVRVEIMYVHKDVFKGKQIKYFVNIGVQGQLDNKTRDDYDKSFQFAMGPYFK